MSLVVESSWPCGCEKIIDGPMLYCVEHRSKMPRQKPGKSKQTYGTPPEFLTAVKTRLQISDFTIDLAASTQNRVTWEYFDEADDSLSQDWAKPIGAGWGWLNPPFAKIGPWAQKAGVEAQKGANIAMLVPASVGANWWFDYVESFAYQSFLNGRLTFVGETAPFPKDCALLLYTPWRFTGHEIWEWKTS